MAPKITAAGFWAVARRPRWIAVLVLALGIAAAFAALGQWQLERSVENTTVVDIDTETPVPLAEIAEPGSGVTEDQLGRTVSVRGEFVPGDFVVLSGRNDGRGGTDSWLVGHLVTDEGVSLAVAIGTTTAPPPGDLRPEREEWVGRYLLTEEPQESDIENGEHSALSVADLINIWVEPGPVYGGYLVLADAAPGLGDIHAPSPEREVALNWLNLFYAVEWVIFGGFALYLWYRLVRDVVEREAEEAQPANVD